ncbi:MAG: DNA adenine methylase [Candidatus Bathyarchaeia archaeon]
MLCVFPYLGGKQYLVKKLLTLIPPHRIYCEPFGGAASLLLNKEPSQLEVYNDLDGELVNLFMVIRDRPFEFLSRLEALLYSREIFRIWAREFREGDAPRDPMERATRFYYVLKSSFAGRSTHVGWAYTKKERKPYFLLDRGSLLYIHDRLRRVYIDHLNYEECIRRWDSPETFFYLDPPYQGASGYPIDFRDEDHRRLAGILRGVEGKWLLTINDTSFIRGLYMGRGYKIEKAETTMASKKIKGGERPRLIHLLIRNYDLAEDEIKEEPTSS